MSFGLHIGEKIIYFTKRVKYYQVNKLIQIIATSGGEGRTKSNLVVIAIYIKLKTLFEARLQFFKKLI